MTDAQKRMTLAVCGLGSWGLILFSWLVLEKLLYLNPCHLCMMQRLAFLLIGLAFLLDAAFFPQSVWGSWLMKFLKYASIFFGIGLAARHLYIQSLPLEKAPKCGLDFWATLEHKGYLEGLWQSMQGTGSCAAKDTFLGLTIPTWSMMGFLVLLVIAVICENNKPLFRIK